MSQRIHALSGIERNTADLDRAIAFYRDALGFRVDRITNGPPAWARLPGVEAAPSRCARIVLGAQQVELTEFPHATPRPPDRAACDLSFQHCAIVVSDMDAAHRRVMRNGATAISRDGPQRLPPATGSVTAFKFRDCDGHPLELIQFPAGTGDPAWQSTHHQDGTPLGIDHSAISVANVERSIRFYELLGLHAAARGLNHGREQQYLDDLADVELDVVAMQPATSRTPHLELLGYHRPRGRPAPPWPVTAIAADRLAWRAEGVNALLDALADAGFVGAVVASGVVDGATIALLHDPDGHRQVLTAAGP